MAKNVLSDVYASLKDEAKADVLKEIQPKIEKLQALGDEILAALSGKKKAGRKPKQTAAKKTKAEKKVAPKAKKGPRTPKGALEAGIRAILLAAQNEPVTMAQIRNELRKTPTFAQHDPNGLYTMASTKIKKMTGVKKVGKTYLAE